MPKDYTHIIELTYANGDIWRQRVSGEKAARQYIRSVKGQPYIVKIEIKPREQDK